MVEKENNNLSDTKTDSSLLENYNADEKNKQQIKLHFLIVFIAIMCVGGFDIGATTSATNQLNTTFKAKFPVYAENPTLYQSLMGSSGILGTTLGAITGGRIIKFGRKKTFMIAGAIGVIGSALCIIEVLPVILIGRVIFGYSTGLFSICVPRFIEEVVPTNLLSTFSPIFTCSQTLGALVCLIMGQGLPDDNDTQGLKDSEFWKIILGFPILLLTPSVLLLEFYIKYESPQFLIFKGQKSQAVNMINQIYKTTDALQIVTHIEYSTQKETQTVSLKDALTSPLYRRATWVTVMLIIFHELTGINVIILYSNSIFSQTSSQSKITPRVGTYLVGVFCFLGCLASVFIVRKFGRRILLIPGHILMGIAHILVGVFAIENLDTAVIVMILTFIIIYEITNSSITWLYASEVVVDSALGVCIFALWSIVLILSLTTNYLMESDLGRRGPKISLFHHKYFLK